MLSKVFGWLRLLVFFGLEAYPLFWELSLAVSWAAPLLAPAAAGGVVLTQSANYWLPETIARVVLKTFFAIPLA